MVVPKCGSLEVMGFAFSHYLASFVGKKSGIEAFATSCFGRRLFKNQKFYRFMVKLVR